MGVDLTEGVDSGIGVKGGIGFSGLTSGARLGETSGVGIGVGTGVGIGVGTGVGLTVGIMRGVGVGNDSGGVGSTLSTGDGGGGCIRFFVAIKKPTANPLTIMTKKIRGMTIQAIQGFPLSSVSSSSSSISMVGLVTGRLDRRLGLEPTATVASVLL